MKRYHYTCSDHQPDIMLDTLRPRPHPWLRSLGPLLWLTDLEDPTPDAVGLGSGTLKCDRLEHRFVVTSKAAVKWTDLRAKAATEAVTTLESYAQPEHWFVVRRPLTVSEWYYDEAYALNRRRAAQP